jgi:hypothetical protein
VKLGVQKLTMVLENQQLGVKNVAFLTPKSFFFVTLHRFL